MFILSHIPPFFLFSTPVLVPPCICSVSGTSVCPFYHCEVVHGKYAPQFIELPSFYFWILPITDKATVNIPVQVSVWL